MSMQRVFLWDIRESIDELERVVALMRRTEKDVENLLAERDDLFNQVAQLEERLRDLEDR
jgi:predicted  nucleic acid-binding Zn-ribbon protein